MKQEEILLKRIISSIKQRDKSERKINRLTQNLYHLKTGKTVGDNVPYYLTLKELGLKV